MAKEKKEALEVLRDFYGKVPERAKTEMKLAKSISEIDRVRMKWVDLAIGYES